MSKHDNHNMHQNSYRAYNEEHEKLNKREKLILDAFAGKGFMMTDREVMAVLGFHDMNMVRPRITSLLEKGLLVEGCTVKCKTTGRQVRCNFYRGTWHVRVR